MLRMQHAIDRRWGATMAQSSADILHALPRVVPPLQQRLRKARQLDFELQPCIRDIWHDHVLFTGESVSGIVDYGAMAMDTVLGDVARLLGSLVGDDSDAWQHGVTAYVERNPLEVTELGLLTAFDRTNVVLGGVNWIHWLFLDNRQFENMAGVAERITEIGARLRHWVNSGAH